MIRDCLLATQETIFVLQEWAGRLEQWQALGWADPGDFTDACCLLREAGLWAWADTIAGHGLAALSVVVIGEEEEENGFLAYENEDKNKDDATQDTGQTTPLQHAFLLLCLE